MIVKRRTPRGIFPTNRRRPDSGAITTALVFVAILMIAAGYFYFRVQGSVSAMGAADGFFMALQAKDWKRVYNFLPTEPVTTHSGGQTFTSFSTLTEEKFAQAMQSKGLMFVGPDYSMKYRVISAAPSGKEVYKVRVSYAVGGPEQMKVYDIDFSKPNSIGAYRGSRPQRLLENTENLTFSRINGRWKYDMWQPNGFGFTPLGAP